MVLNHNYFSIYTIGEKSKNTIIPTMADVVEKISQENTLGMFRLVTIAAHITSLSLALVVHGNNSGSYPKHHLMTEQVNAQTGEVVKSTATISDLQAPAMQMVSDIVVLVVSILLFLRDLDVKFFKRLIDYEGKGEGEDAPYLPPALISLLHVISYAFTSVISTLMIYMFFGGKSFLVAFILSLLSIGAEAAKHMIEINGRRSGVARLIGISGMVASITILMVNILTYANSSGLDDTEVLVAGYFAALGGKVVHEYLISTWGWYGDTFDRRHGHLVFDLALKGGVAWSVITREMYLAKDPIDDKTLADAIPWVTIALVVIGFIAARLIPKDKRTDLQAPSGSMEEKERMLQVA